MVNPTSFCFLQCETVDPADVSALASTVKRALSTYGTPIFEKMIQNCMAQELSWKVNVAKPNHDHISL